MSRPSFAIVGAVNHGKSSVAATLAESEAVGISDFPGETAACQRFVCRDLFALWDTPGFQNPHEMLRAMGEAARAAADPLEVFRAFAGREKGREDFAAEVELLRPLLDGAAILYVVDTSQPLEKLHEAEMEILRLTGRPRLAVLNPTRAPMHEAAWRARLGQQFGAVQEFNAHRASAHDRAELLRAMAMLSAEWKERLRAAADALEADGAQQLREAATILIELLDEALTHTERDFLPRSRMEEKAAVLEKTKARFYDALAAREAKAHRALIELFQHRRVEMGEESGGSGGVLVEELHHAETWKLLGLNRWMLGGVGLTGGGAAGAAFGLHLEWVAPGHGTAAGTVVGGGVGGMSAMLLGKRIAQPAVKYSSPEETPGKGIKRVMASLLGALTRTGTTVTVGPLLGENFPYILLDRGLGLLCYLNSRTHARRDHVSLKVAQLKEELDRLGASTEKWPGDLLAAAKKHVKALRRGKLTEETRKEFLEKLTRFLQGMAGRGFTYGNDGP